MNRYLAILLAFIILFLFVFLIDFFLIKKHHYKKNSKKKKKKTEDLVEIGYLVGKFKLNKDMLINNKILALISCINSLIISIVAIVVLLLPIHATFQLLIGFILLIALIYSLYELLGRILVKRGFNTNGK